MKSWSSVRLLAFAVAATVAAPELLWAHHSPAAFDLAVERELQGTLTEVAWRNPHVYLTLETTDAAGAKTRQAIEAVGTSGMASMNVRREDFVVGENVSVRANPSRRGAGREMLGLVLTTATGKQLPLRGGFIAPPPASGGAMGLQGAWLTDFAAFNAEVVAVARSSWPLTEAGMQAAADLTARSKASADCSPFGIPAQMLTPGLTVITVAEDQVTLEIDGASTSRVVHLNVAAPPVGTPSSAQGYSVGRWEGGSLLIETTLFTADPEGLGFALPSSEGKRVSERLTPGQDGSTLVYEATLQDPYYLREPKTFRSTWTYHPEMTPSRQACDLDAAVRFAEPQ